LLSQFLKWKETKPVLLLTVCFIVSRVLFRIAGVVFYGEFIRRLWQSIDVELLKTSLFESLYYSHAQPPLFNLLSGIILKIFPSHYSFAFHIVFLVIGWLNCLLIYFSLRKFKLNAAISLVITIVFMLLPSVVLYENLYSYTYINVFLLTLSVYLLLSFSEKQNVTLWVLFCITLCALVLLRSFYHITWLITLVGIALVFFRNTNLPFERLVFSSSFLIAFVLIWLVKNWILFGTFTTSTWMGMNLARVMPPSTPIGVVGPFKPIHAYPIRDQSKDFASVKLLHEEYKIKSGFVNYYHIDYIALSNQFKQDAIAEITANPLKYLSRVGSAYVIYFSPASHAPFIDANYHHIESYASVVNANFSGYTEFKRDNFPIKQSLPVLALHVLLVVAMSYCFSVGMFGEKERPVLWIMSLMLLYAVIIGNFFEYGENNRFRFEHLSIFVLLLSKTLYALTQRMLLAWNSRDKK
jgi:hypothetical protein